LSITSKFGSGIFSLCNCSNFSFEVMFDVMNLVIACGRDKLYPVTLMTARKGNMAHNQSEGEVLIMSHSIRSLTSFATHGHFCFFLQSY
jgi:hypothetical protein